MVTDVLTSLWHDTCSVTVGESYTKENLSTGFREIVLYQNVPCKLSYFKTRIAVNSPNKNNDVFSEVTQNVKVFLAPDLVIPPGSKLAITRNGITTQYKNSGKAAVYTNHQEILLELFDKWA